MNIHQEVYGQGKSIVLIHGWAMHTGIWRGFAKQLAQQYQVICIDLPGHGLSDAVEPYSLEIIIDSIIEVLPVTSFSVLGWSLGASVALALVDKYPQKVESLVLLAGNPHFVETNEWAGMRSELLDDFADKLSEDCQLTLIRFLSMQVSRLRNGKALLKELKVAVNECRTPSEQVLHGGLAILKESDLRSQLKNVQCPVNLIQGDKDTLVPVRASQHMQQLQPASALNIIAGAGHVPFLSHPSQMIDIINKFI